MQPGSVLSNRYRLVSLLGHGGMGAVWRAEHLGLNAPVAVKLLGAALEAGNPEVIARFQREAQSTAQLRSPHVVQVLDHGFDEATHTPFIVMELLEGQSLSERLHQAGRLHPLETCQIVTHVSRALTRAHELTIVHRDLKPGNVFLVRNDDEPVAKVLDFGIAKWHSKSADAGNLTGTNALLGTPYYMSPEQITGAKHTDHRADLWALSVTAYECLTGSRPFTGDNVVAIAMRINGGAFTPPTGYGLAPAFDGFFTRAFARQPEHRFQSAKELSEELRRVVGLGSSVNEPSTVVVGTAAETLPSGEQAPGGGGGPRTVTAVASVVKPPEPAPRKAPSARAAWVVLPLFGLLAVAGVAAFQLMPEGEVGGGLPSAASSVLERAAMPKPPPVPVAPASTTTPVAPASTPQTIVIPVGEAAPSVSITPGSGGAATQTGKIKRQGTGSHAPGSAPAPPPPPPQPNIYDTRH